MIHARTRFFLIAIALALAACAGSVTPQTPAQIVFKAHGDYAAALPIAIQYRNLPPCGPAAPKVVCRDPDTLKRIQAADNEAFKALQAAQAAVRLGDGTGGAAEATEARKAIAAFKKQTNSLPKVKP